MTILERTKITMRKVNKRFIEELGKVLKQFDVKALDDFINTHKEYYNDDLIWQWNNTTEVIKEISLCKMIIARTDMPYYLQVKAFKRLDEIRKELKTK